MKKSVLVAAFAVLTFQRSFAQDQCTATITNLQVLEDHIAVSGKAEVTTSCTATYQQIILRFLSDVGGNTCTSGAVCTATDVPFDTKCLADGIWDVYATGNCHTSCGSPTGTDQKTFSLHRTVMLSLGSEQHVSNPRYYDILANYTITNAYDTARSIAVYDAKTNTWLGSCSPYDTHPPTGICRIHDIDAACGVEIRGEAVACGDPASKVVAQKIALPPAPAALRPVGCSLRGCRQCRPQPNASDCHKCQNKAVGTPINVGKGDVALSLPLFSLAEPAGQLSFELFYDSERPVYPSFSGEMGLGWSHSLSQSVRAIGPNGSDSHLYHVSPEGLETIYEQNGTTWVASFPAGVRDVITNVASEYRLTSQDGSVVSFDVASGHWLASTDRWGNSTTATYDAAGNLTRVTDPLGRTIDVIANGTALQQITLPGGATWQFGYTNGNLTSIRDPLHPSPGSAWRTFEYTANQSGEPRLLTSMKDDVGIALESHTYDTQDRGLSSSGAGGRDQVTVQYEVPSAGMRRVTHQIDATTTQGSDFTVAIVDGEWVTTNVSGGCATCDTPPGETRVFDASGKLTRTTNAAGVATAFTYDGAGNVLTTTEADGTSLARVSSYEYATTNWVTFRTKETIPGPFGTRVTARTLSPDERTLTAVVTGRASSGGPTVSYTTTTTFDARHRVVSVDGPRTDVTDTETRSYYAETDPNVNRRGRVQTVTTATGLVTTYDDYDVYGTARRMTDPNGVVTTIETDASGRTTAVVSQPVTGDSSETATYRSTTTYDTRDRLSATLPPRGNKIGYAYEDGTNRLTDTIRYDLAGNQVERLHLTLSLAGWKIQEDAQSCSTPAVVCSSWTTRRTESFTYDDQGRLKDVIHGDGTKQTYAYDNVNRVSSVKDENHSTPNTNYGYDVLNRLQNVTQTLAGAVGGTITTSYSYNVQDQLTSVTDPNGNTTAYEYDDFARLTRQTSPVTGATTYSYDAAGNLIASTDANSATTTRTYDAANRVLSLTATRSGAPTENVTWSYDAATGYGRGRLTAMSDPSGSTTYEYERRGLLRRETRTLEGNSYQTAYTYDSNGNRAGITYPSGRVVSYTFDLGDRQNGITTGGTSIVSGAAYLPFGPLTQLTYGNGTTVTRSYDNRFRLSTNKLTHAATVLAQYDYGYDSVSNITSIADSVDSTYNRTFTYDDINRLLSANSGSNLWGNGAYSYDRMGNTLALQLGATRAASFAYSGTTPKLTSVTENGSLSAISYDAAGNETAVGTSGYTYSSRNALASAPSFSYLYDGRGVRTITSTATSGVTVVGLTINPSSVGGGDAATGTVTLSGPAGTGGVTVALLTDDRRIAQAPPTIYIPAGSTSSTFALTTFRPAVSSLSTIVRAFHQGSTVSTSVTVLRLPRVSTLGISPTSVTAGTAATGTVSIDISMPADTTVALSSSNSAVASVPATVIVPANSTSATFQVTTYNVASDTTVTITATYRGTASAALTVTTPSVTVTSVAINPSSVVGGLMNPVGTVTLSAPANPGGAIVNLTSSNTTAATVPSTLTVAAGSASATFTVTTSTVGASTPVTITAIYGATLTGSLTVGTCTTWTADTPILGNETVWFDDAVPAGATIVGTWQWPSAQKVTGTVSHDDPATAGFHQHYFYGTTQPITLNTSMDQLVGYVLVDPCNPPREVMMHWNDGTSWEHRAFWGADLINAGVSGTTSRQPMGALPSAGQWVRLAVPASKVGLRGMTVYGMGFGLYDGHAWFDRIGTSSCTTPVAPASTNLPSTDTIWFDDDTPAGATLLGTWQWDTAQKTSGTKSHTEPRADGWYQHYFTGGAPTLPLSVGEKLIAYVLIDPCEPTDEIMIGWFDGGSWEHRAYWGANNINAGVDGTNSRRRIGDLPSTGGWVRLEVPAAQVGLEGATAQGIVFAMWGGRVWWDRIGKSPAGSGALAPTISSSVLTADATPSLKTRLFALVRRVREKLTGATPPVNLAVTTRLTAQPTAAGALRQYSFYTPELQLISETALSETATPSVAFDYVWFNGEPAAQIDSTSGAITYYLNDHLGTPIVQTDAAGMVVWQVEREPYGERFLMRTGGDRHQPLDFPGQEVAEQAPEFRYNIFRWYGSGWGRYTQADPLGLDTGNVNLYAYGDADPIGESDPYGLLAQLLCRQVTVTGLPPLKKAVVNTYKPQHCRLRIACGCGSGSGDDFDLTIGRENVNPHGSPGIYKLTVDNYSSSSYPALTWNVTPVGSTGTDCQFEKCALKAFKAQYSNSGLLPTYNAAGPNSNTFVHNIIKQCGGTAPRPPRAWGWNSP